MLLKSPASTLVAQVSQLANIHCFSKTLDLCKASFRQNLIEIAYAVDLHI
jgi:hypothetical protein